MQIIDEQGVRFTAGPLANEDSTAEHRCYAGVDGV